MSTQQRIPGVLIFAAFIFFPPIGIVLLILNYVMKNQNTNQTVSTSTNQSSEDNVITQITNQFTNQGDEFQSRRRPSKEKILDETVMVRCPNCQSSNFVDRLPYTCEYCGNILNEK